MFRCLLLASVWLTMCSTAANAEPVVFECEETFAFSGRQKHIQVSVDVEHKTVRVGDAIWMDGAKLGNGIGAWVRIEGHIVRWGFSRDGEEISGGTAELDLLAGSYHEWVEAPDDWLSRGTCTRSGLTN